MRQKEEARDRDAETEASCASRVVAALFRLARGTRSRIVRWLSAAQCKSDGRQRVQAKEMMG